MGWLYTQGQTKQGLVEKLTRPYENKETNYKTTCLKHHVVGNHLWAAFEVSRDGATERFICLFLMASQRDFGWGYKDIDESMGPCETDCPVSLFDLAPTPANEYAKEWRKEVMESHARKARLSKLQVGATVTFVGGGKQKFTDGAEFAEVQIHSVKPLVGIHNGRLYRLRRASIAV